MKARNMIMTPEDEALLTPENLRKWADYEGDHENCLLMRAMARRLLLDANPTMKPDYVAQFLDSKARELPLSARASMAVLAAGYNTVRDLYEDGWRRLMRQRNFGERSRLELVDLFARHGLIWREEISEAPKIPVNEAKISCPLSLYSTLVNTAQAHLDDYVKQHGRFATRGKLFAEFTQREMVVVQARVLLLPHIHEETDND